MRECQNAGCRFRYPQEVHPRRSDRCPRCGDPTQIVATYSPATAIQDAAKRADPPLEVLIDNVRSAYNLGSILRTADGAGVRHLHLCGITPTPAHSRVAKTALGAEQSVAWTYHANGLLAATNLQGQDMALIGLEGGPRATSLFAPTEGRGDKTDMRPRVLIVGGEVTGIDPAILALCERVVSIPMRGVKRSLNVAVAFGIAVYTLRFGRMCPEKGNG